MALRDVDVSAVLARLGIDPRRQGRELWARCPFHEERDASWRIRDDPGHENHAVWQCFGSCPEGARSGSIVVLVRRLLDLPAREDAWRWIREGGGEREPVKTERVRVTIREQPAAFGFPAGVVFAPVGEWVSVARRYLVETRRVTPAQVARWGIGYAAQGLLAGRIVIPVRDARGRLLSYTARTYVGSPKKFREPDKADGADKGSVFGEQRWPPAAERRLVVLSEAPLKALAIERAAAVPIAAIQGSELLPAHVARLSSFREILVASDPDAAGDKLFEQTRRHLGRFSRVARVVLPPGKDPDGLEQEPGGREMLAAVILAA